jgi:hypothetical protein
MPSYQQLFLLFFGSLFLLCLLIYFWLRRPPAPGRLPPRPLIPPVLLPTVFVKFEDELPFNEQGQLEDQNFSWRGRMLRAGQTMASANVQQIYFLHGTFAGSDPFNVLPPLKNLMPQVAAQWEQIIEAKMKKAVDKFAGDIGNFLPHYVKLFQEATGQLIPCQTLHWSSANHHWGRLQGAIRLIEELNLRYPDQLPGTILLIGHSHARQVFALFTQLISDSLLSKNIWSLMHEEQLGTTDLPLKAQKLAHGFYDFVTLGGPLRYPFAATDRMRFLHLVNHRGRSELAEHMLNPWTTAGGDYVQQWGCPGSDTLATTHKERVMNRQLDAWLGKGMDTRTWVHSVASRLRVGEMGRTVLVDYCDQGGFRINCLPTVFGHGIYTRYRVMLFNTEIICRYLYSDQEA